MTSVGKDTTVAAASEAELLRRSSGWSTALREVVAELRVISCATEDEFLSIGGRLQDFYQRGCGISSLASEMTGEVGGEHVACATGGLEEILDTMGRYVGRAQQEICESAGTLREILKLLDQVSEPLSGFKKVNKVLRMLGISTKIESARLGASAEGFDTLASDVADLSVQVSDKAAIILGRKEELARAIGQTLTVVLDSGARQHEQVLATLDRTRLSLESLTAINSRSQTAVVGVAAVSDEVSRNLSEVVTSMQAHDIVRQQIEHVEATLGELQKKVAAGEAGAKDVVCICELQVSQLRHANEELVQAVDTIIASLAEVAKKQSGLCAKSRDLAGIADQVGGSFFSQIEQDIAVVSSALLESVKVNRSLCLALGAVTDTVGEITTFVGDIEKIGEEIKLIALNAQIKSAYTGEEGAALGVLASAIQRLSIDAIDHTGAVSGTLQAIVAVTSGLNEGVCIESQVLEGEVHDMVAKLGTLLEVLRQVNETLCRSLCHMDDEALRLTREIGEVTAGITVQQRVSQVLEHSVDTLAGVISQARLIAPGTASSTDLEEISRRYTMQSQRNIHDSHLNRKAPSGGAPLPHRQEEFDDNVEFF